jgi:hypothetical protein
LAIVTSLDTPLASCSPKSKALRKWQKAHDVGLEGLASPGTKARGWQKVRDVGIAGIRNVKTPSPKKARPKLNGVGWKKVRAIGAKAIKPPSNKKGARGWSMLMSSSKAFRSPKARSGSVYLDEAAKALMAQNLAPPPLPPRNISAAQPPQPPGVFV